MFEVIGELVRQSEVLQQLYAEQEERFMANNLKSVGSLWLGTAKNNGKMLSGFIDCGILGQCNLMCFENLKKQKAKDPDYFVSIKIGESLRSVGSLWKGQSKNGTMLSGSISFGVLNDRNIMIFKNTNKKKEKDPDYFISINLGEKAEDVPLPPTNGDDL